MVTSSKIKGLAEITLLLLKDYRCVFHSKKKPQSLNILFLVPLYHTNMLAMVQSLRRANHSIGVIAAKEKADLCPVFLPNRIYNARPWMWEQLKKDGLWDEVKVFHARGLNTPKATALFRIFKHKFGW